MPSEHREGARKQACMLQQGDVVQVVRVLTSGMRAQRRRASQRQSSSGQGRPGQGTRAEHLHLHLHFQLQPTRGHRGAHH